MASSRRSFLAKLFGGTLLAGIGGILAAVVAYLFPGKEVSSALGPQRVRVGKVDEIPPGQGRLTLVRDEPVWVLRLSSGFVGMSALCTHQGCIVQWQAGRRVFVCPCHQGRFDERGNVIAGFPLHPLGRYRVGVVDGVVYVSAGEERES